MPKEVIRDVAGQFDVTVGWNRAPGEVQIATVVRPPERDGEPRTLRELVESWPEGAGRYHDDTELLTGLWSTLDRRQLNELIRVLRKARDAAFGRDE
jgi:hypothetical protein